MHRYGPRRARLASYPKYFLSLFPASEGGGAVFPPKFSLYWASSCSYAFEKTSPAALSPYPCLPSLGECVQ